MKDYYQILGVQEEASVEEIEARWAELMGQYRSRLHKREGEAPEMIKEVKEAYEVLTDPSKRKEYDSERLLKRSSMEVHRHRKQRYDTKKLIIPVSVAVLILITGFFTFEMALLTFQRKPVVPAAPAPVPEEERVTSPSEPLPSEMSEVPDQKSSQNTPEQIVESQEAISPVAESPKKELEAKEKIAEEPVKIEKPILKKMPKPISEKRPKVEEPKPVSAESRPAIPHVPVSEGVKKPEDVIANQKDKAKATPKEVPIPSPKPVAPIAAIPPAPQPFAKENEVRQFLVKYVDRYTQRDIEGFLSFFSPMAIQNQKDGIEQIRKMYSRQFELYERLKYQLKDPKIEILEKSVKIRALYEIEQFSKGETKQLRGEIEWDLVKEGRELKILTIQYRTHKTR